jgi:hypothetical protein
VLEGNLAQELEELGAEVVVAASPDRFDDEGRDVVAVDADRRFLLARPSRAIT